MKLNLEVKALESEDEASELAQELLILNPMAVENDAVGEMYQQELLRALLFAAKDKAEPNKFLSELLKTKTSAWVEKLEGESLEQVKKCLGCTTENYSDSVVLDLYRRLRPTLN